ncbi:hypothetical protein VF12_36050, partial [Nostoc linckia z15]
MSLVYPIPYFLKFFMILSIEINFPELVLQRWQTAKDIVNQRVNTLNNSVEQISESLKAKATTTTNTAID